MAPYNKDRRQRPIEIVGGASVRPSAVTIPGTPAFRGIMSAIGAPAGFGAGNSAQPLLILCDQAKEVKRFDSLCIPNVKTTEPADDIYTRYG